MNFDYIKIILSTKKIVFSYRENNQLKIMQVYQSKEPEIYDKLEKLLVSKKFVNLIESYLKEEDSKDE